MKKLCLKPLLLATLASAAVFAQSSSGGGSIQGTVKDATGAVLAKSKLTILHIETGRATDTVANNDGFFSTPPMSIGRYRIRVESPGMKAWAGEIVLETGRIAEVNPTLSPGQVNETVTVSETIPLVTTTEATDASTLDSTRIKELPINGRDLNTLLGDVTPGVEPVIDVNGGIRTSGLMVYSTNYMQDGAASNNREFGGSMNLQGLESIGEVRVETSTSSAKHSYPTSVIVTTKGGANALHLAVYETARNNAFGVARARQDISFTSTPYQTPKLIRNEFGGSIGGPILIPKVYNGRNRTFFFFSREGVELRQGLTRDFTVPTPAMRNGDFSDLVDSSGRRLTLYDPLTTSHETLANGRVVAVRLPFINNVIPSRRESPLAKRIWGITPLPTDPGANPLVTTNLKVAVPTNGSPNLSDNPTTIRVDHRVSSNDNFFIKVNGGRRITNFLGTGTGTGAPTANGEANVTYLPMQAVAGALSWTHIFSPRLFVETVANHTWQSTKTITGPLNAQKDWAKELGLPNPYAEIGFPNITSLGNFMTYTEGDNRRALTTRVLNVAQNYQHIRGTHDIQHLCGETEAPDFPATPGSFTTPLPDPIPDFGLNRAFVARWDPASRRFESIEALGTTITTLNLDTIQSTAGALWPIARGKSLLLVLDEARSQLVYASGLPEYTYAQGLTLDTDGSLTIAGRSEFHSIPPTIGARLLSSAAGHYIAKLDPFGHYLTYATYLEPFSRATIVPGLIYIVISTDHDPTIKIYPPFRVMSDPPANDQRATIYAMPNVVQQCGSEAPRQALYWDTPTSLSRPPKSVQERPTAAS